MKISFDFDGTLENKTAQKLAALLISMGFEIWIVTTRWDDTYSTNVLDEPTRNDDLYEVAKALGIPNSNIVFTNMTWKVDYFMNNKDFLFHVDDNLTEVKAIHGKAKVKTFSCWGTNGTWYNKALKLATNYLKRQEQNN